jgi:Tfp pilus assembly protein PilF
LLLSIAEQYYKIQQPSAAKQYLFRIIQNSENDELIIKSRNLLANIYIDSQEYSDAKSEFELILQKNKNFADAYYGLGVIYEKQGDLVKARSEWRKALKLQVNHAGALAKISDYK